MSPSGLLQASQAPTGLLVAIGVFAIALAFLIARGLADWLLGPDPPTARYRLVEAGEGLVLADAEDAGGQRLVGLDEGAMAALMDEAEDRNEMRLHVVLDRDGDQHDWEAWRADADREVPAGLILEDSKGLVEIHDSGRVEATPPLDEAVRGDLLEVLADVLAGDSEHRGT